MKPSPTSDHHRQRRCRRTGLGTFGVAALIAGATIGGARPSLAAPAASGGDPKVAARKKLVEGADLLRRGEYQDALARFQAAYDLVPSPKIQYNFGLAYTGLGRNADALDAFDKFLRESDGASVDTISKAQGHRAELSQKVGRVLVRADLDGASIGIDGRSYGTTPRAQEIFVDAGAHLLLVEKPGVARQFTRRFDAVPGQGLTIEAHLLVPEPKKPPRVAPPPVVAGGGPDSTPAAGGARPVNLSGIVTAPTPEPTPARSRWAKPAAFTTGGLALVGLGLGAFEWMTKEQKFGKFNDNPTCNLSAANDGGADCVTLWKDGDHAKRLGYIGFAAGGALAVASAVLFVVAAGQRPTSGTETALVCAPSLTTPGGACSLRF